MSRGPALDLLTQGLLGAALAQSAAPARETRIAAAVGFAAGLLPDADALIRSPADPLLVLEFHRHFSHSLLFVPLGALLAALLCWPFTRRRLGFARLYLYALLGYALAGLLDACTSYGTHLLWPFSDTAVAWSIIAIVDPVFTLLLLVPLLWGLWKRRASVTRAGLVLAALYLALGVLQHQRAERLAGEVAHARGIVPQLQLVKPTIGNVLLWRAVTVADGRVYTDGLRLGLGDGVRVYEGESAPLLDIATAAPAGTRLAIDTARFAAFAHGLLVRHPNEPELIGDARYALLPTSAAPLWGVLPGADVDQAPAFVARRELTPLMRAHFIDMLLGRDLTAP